MKTEYVGPREGAALLMAFFEERGARFDLVDGFLVADINSVDFSRLTITPEQTIAAILGFREDIKTICARR